MLCSVGRGERGKHLVLLHVYKLRWEVVKFVVFFKDHVPLPKLPESSNGVIYQLYSKSFLKGRQSVHDTVSW